MRARTNLELHIRKLIELNLKMRVGLKYASCFPTPAHLAGLNGDMTNLHGFWFCSQCGPKPPL